uniref:Uncharacterized protein n=1 Tax=Nelumbo nucifera TaxID=4432 RepID=A0A822ZKF5_NELNU|nr:TPA_asm: hypothetical protein HUJ06_003872 [Nelumbo nucifera]
MKIVEFYYNMIYGVESNEYVLKIRMAIYDLFMDYVGRSRDPLPLYTNFEKTGHSSNSLSKYGVDAINSNGGGEDLADFEKWCIDQGIVSSIVP